jgi:hypothetical protein
MGLSKSLNWRPYFVLPAGYMFGRIGIRLGVGGGSMEETFELQRWLYANAIGALNALQTTGLAELPSMVVAALGFGMLHALLPGHGKSVLTSYYAGDGGWRGALASSTILIVTHVGSAVVLVLTGFALLEKTIGSAGRRRCWNTPVTSSYCCWDFGFSSGRYGAMRMTMKDQASLSHS